MKFKRSTSINIIVTIAYLFLIGLLVFQVVGITDKYNSEELDMITEIERAMKNALDQPNDLLMIQKLAPIVDEYPFDIVITRDEDIIYNTVPYVMGENMLNRMHTKAVARQSQGHLENNGDDLFIWYSIYRLTNSQFVTKFLHSILLLIVILSILIALTIYIILKTLMKPLKNIERSLSMATDYRLTPVTDSDDKINKEFNDFVSKLESDMSDVNIQHTELEKQLQAKRESLRSILSVSNVMMKHIEVLIQESKEENMKYLMMDASDKELLSMSQFNIKSNNEILEEIKRVIDMLEKDQGYETEISEVNIVNLVMAVVSTFHKQMYAKELSLDFDGPHEALIKSEETTLILLINNILMNMVLYATEKTQIKIEINQNDKTTELLFVNESSETNIEHMKNTEHLFNAIKDSENKDYVYSSGNGLYITKELTNILNGEYKVQTTKTLVTISIILSDGLKETN